jgi:hypothetical protein
MPESKRAAIRCAAVLAAAWLTWSPSAAFSQGGDSRPPTLDEIAKAMREASDKLQSLHVAYTAKAEGLDKPEVLKKILGVAYLIDEKKEFAFKGDKRYYSLAEPQAVEPIAPGVETDYTALAKGDERKKGIDEQRRRSEEILGKSAVARALDRPTIRRDSFTQVAFDGKIMTRKTPGREFAERIDAAAARDDEGWFTQDYMNTIGRTLPDAVNRANDRKSLRLPDAFADGVAAVQAEREVVEGTPCVVVNWPGREKFWLDPAHSYAVVRRELYDPGSGLLVTRRENSEFAEVRPGIRLPYAFRFEICAAAAAPEPYRGKPMMRYNYRVTKLSVNDVPDSQFELPIEPGTTVVDVTHSSPKGTSEAQRAISYVMPADKNQLDETLRRAIEARDEPNRSAAKTWWVVAAVNVVLVVVAGAVWLRRTKAAG